MRLAIGWRPDVFVEIGPGGVLAGLMGRIDKSVHVLRVEDVTSLRDTAAALTRNGA
jgi:[acyl-carrier-protein] S-malonyltransferase